MAESPANVRLSLAATAENVVLVREMLAGIADGVGLDATHLNDIQTAVTEACNNVVLHAYDGEQGPLEVEVRVRERTFAIRVLDHGIGIGTRADTQEQEGDGIGLHVIRTLARTVDLDLPYGGGVMVCMEFDAPHATPLAPDRDDLRAHILELDGAPSVTKVSIAPVALARTVLPRFVSALAARSHFTTDRISDVQLLADALVAHAGSALSCDRLDVSVDVQPRALELCIAPLSIGRAQRLISESELDGLGKIIEKLADRSEVNTVGGYEALTLHVADRR